MVIILISVTTFICQVPRTMPGKKEYRPPLRELDDNVKRSQKNAFAEGTLRNLTTQWVRFLIFTISYCLTPLPVSENDICRYAQYLDGMMTAHETVLNYISGVKTLHVLLGYTTKQFESLLLKLTLRGIKRNNNHIPNQAPPVDVGILHAIYALLNLNKEEDLLFWLVLLVGFFLLFRKCNLVPDSNNKFDPTKQICREHVSIFQNHARVVIHWTKNQQFSKEPLTFALPRIPGSILCPVDTLERLFKLVPVNSDKVSCFQRSDGTIFTYP